MNRIDPSFWDENEGDETNPFNIYKKQEANTGEKLRCAYDQMIEAFKEDGLDEVNARRALCVFFLMRIRAEGIGLDSIRELLDKIENRGK